MDKETKCCLRVGTDMALSSRSSPLCTPAQGQPGHGKQKGERQGDEPQYLGRQHRRSGRTGEGVRHPACGARAALSWRGSTPRGRARRGSTLGAGLGMGAGVITGNRLAAFPAPMTVVLVMFRSGIGPGMAAGGMVGNRLAAFPGPMSVLVALLRFGKGPGGEALAGGLGDADGLADAERAGLALAVGDTERVGLALGVGLGEPERVGLALGVGLGEPERVGLALGVGLEDAERVGLGVGDGDGERVGLGVGVGVGDADGVELAVGVGAAVDGEAEGDADFDGDGLGELEALGPELVLAAAEGEGEGEGEAVAALANAGSCVLTDSPARRKPPVTRPAITARRCARDISTACLCCLCGLARSYVTIPVPDQFPGFQRLFAMSHVPAGQAVGMRQVPLQYP